MRFAIRFRDREAEFGVGSLLATLRALRKGEGVTRRASDPLAALPVKLSIFRARKCAAWASLPGPYEMVCGQIPDKR